LYWVNDSGTWFERQHWSLASGGPGGACVPTAIDDVIFDANSFSGPDQYVGLGASDAAIAHDMTWIDVPDFVGINDGRLDLTGSLTLEQNIRFYPWTMVFRSDSLDNEIFSAGKRNTMD